MGDVRYAIRALLRQPVFATVAILTLAVGIGANAAIFSLLYQVFLRPLPYPEADRLVYVWNTYPKIGLPKASVSIPDYLDRRTGSRAVEDAALFTDTTLALALDGEPAQLRALAVTPSFFSTLRRQPLLGRSFTETDATEGASHVVILTHALWTARFAADPSAVGREIRLSGEPYVVIGVLPADFLLPSRDVSVVVPFAFTAAQKSDAARGNEFSRMIARLGPSATVEQFDAEMKAIVRRNLERLPERRAGVEASGFGGYAVPLREELIGDSRSPVIVLQVSVGLLLLIACVNVANLLLMRATGRSRELAVRAALGAGRRRLIRQTLTEGLVLSMAGGFGGLALGLGGVRLLVASSSTQLPAFVRPTVQPAVLLFTFAIALATGLFFGMVPALAVMRGNVGTILKDDATRGSAGRGVGATRAILVVAETALALILLVGAGLLVKTMVRLEAVNPGFTADHVLTAQISLPAARYPDGTRRLAFWERLLEKTRAIPGVTAVGLTSNVPFNGMVSSGTYYIVGRTLAPGEAPPHGRQEVADAGYFRAMQIPLIKGRLFDDGDIVGGRQVVIVDQFLVNRYFPNTDPIGQQLRRGGPTSPPFTIVGVVGTINAIDLGEPVAKERIYVPLKQTPRPEMGLVVKSAQDPTALVASVRSAVQSIDSEQPLSDVRTMEEWVARSLQGRRTPMVLLVLFGVAALTLAALGTYGVLAFAVAQRERELGIRQALGADRRAIFLLVLRQGLRSVVIGLALGLGFSMALSRYLQDLLFGVNAIDFAVFASVSILLLFVAAVACYIPARRATSIEAATALRI